MIPDVRELVKRISALMTVQDITQELMSELDHLRLLDKILRAAVQVLDAETGSILLWVPPDHLKFAVSDETRMGEWIEFAMEPASTADSSSQMSWSAPASAVGAGSTTTFVFATLMQPFVSVTSTV